CMVEVIDEGITEDYKIELAQSFLYKSIVNALSRTKPSKVPKPIRSAGEEKWGTWPVSDGQQYSKTQSWKAPVSLPIIKLTAMYQAMGQLEYTHDMPLPPTGAHLAFVQSRRALANFELHTPGHTPGASARKRLSALHKHLAATFTGFIRLVTATDVSPHGNLQGMGADQPLFATDQVRYYGQAIAVVAARTEQEAIDIANYISESCVHYETVKWDGQWDQAWTKPILSLDQAIEMDSVFPDCPKPANFVSHVWKITRPGSDLSWVENKKPLDKRIRIRKAKITGVPVLIVEGTQTSGSQIHFYMEPQGCVAQHGNEQVMIVHPSTQSPMEMHQTSALALGVEYNQVKVRVKHVGGGYGGKTEQTRFVTGATVVAAQALAKPVRMALPREEDTAMIGKRHPYYGQYQIAVGSNPDDPDTFGRIIGFHSKMWGDGGAYYDCSFIVSNCIQLRVDNAYRVPNFENQLDVCRTNKAPNTAFRAFGDIQGKLIVENAIDDAAAAIDMDPARLRRMNMYERGDVTPFGQALSYCYMRQVWDYLESTADLAKRREQVETFNRENKWRKQGIYMLPVKYGSGYNLVMLEQASAVVSVYANDGSVVIHQGGVEMGQGMMTQIVQVASYVLNVPMDFIRLEDPDTSVIPNPTSTGGSTGTAYNGEAVKRACEQLRKRLMEFAYEVRNTKGDEWCHQQGVDFWNYGEYKPPGEQPDPDKRGWATKLANGKMIWQNLVYLAFSERISLVSAFNAPVPGGTTPVPALTYKCKKDQPNIPGIEVDPNAVPGGAVDSFVGFTYSAACTQVEVDILTGEVKVLRSDLVYDMGWSLNPALDTGQVEGAFVQGLGYVFTEKLVFEGRGTDDDGRLNTLNTWRYKPPAITTIPLELNVHLFPRDLAIQTKPGCPDEVSVVPENPNDLFSAKEVGEPPLVLAASAFFAVKAAIRASRVERELSPMFRMDAPATVQEVRRACEVDPRSMDIA
ncbi:MAG: molybdopterin-dependent oxidoreductase, partial [Myxococcales bacterium]|nr:molybdopterin-dependent oxidoreductase [Myxococcales bacterium]